MADAVTVSAENYTSRQHNVTLPAEMTRVSFDIAIINDNVLEFNQQFDLIIDQSSLPVDVNVGSIFEATVLVADDDGKLFCVNLCDLFIVRHDIH